MGIFYKTRVSDLMAAPKVTCRGSDDVRDVASRMRESGTGSAVVVAEDGRPVGIVTERDVVYKVVAHHWSGTDDTPTTVADIMSAPPVTVSPDDFLFGAVGLMTRHRCRRLIVTDGGGHLVGVLSMQAVMRLQAYDSHLIVADLVKTTTLKELCEVRGEIDAFIQRLYVAEVDGRTLAEILTDLNDLVVRRVIAINEAKLRAVGHTTPLCRFAWVSFGSEGRREQVLRGDQDNGIIIDDVGVSPKIVDYYRRLAAGVNEDLATYGFDICQGGVMAREDAYFGTLGEWVERVGEVVGNVHIGKEGRRLTILLDMRHLAGDGRLVKALWDSLLDQVKRTPPAQWALAHDAAKKTVPLNILGRLRYEQTKDGRRGINVKRYGMLGLIAATKALAIEQGLALTETYSRIRALGACGVLDHHTTDNLLAANELFMKLRFQASMERVFHGGGNGLVFYPEEWNEWEREDLKRAFRAVDKLLGLVRTRYSI